MQKISFLLFFNLSMGNFYLYGNHKSAEKTFKNYKYLENKTNELIENTKRKKNLKLFNILSEIVLSWMLLNLSLY